MDSKHFFKSRAVEHRICRTLCRRRVLACRDRDKFGATTRDWRLRCYNLCSEAVPGRNAPASKMICAPDRFLGGNTTPNEKDRFRKIGSSSRTTALVGNHAQLILLAR